MGATHFSPFNWTLTSTLSWTSSLYLKLKIAHLFPASRSYILAQPWPHPISLFTTVRLNRLVNLFYLTFLHIMLSFYAQMWNYLWLSFLSSKLVIQGLQHGLYSICNAILLLTHAVTGWDVIAQQHACFPCSRPADLNNIIHLFSYSPFQPNQLNSVKTVTFSFANVYGLRFC